MNGLRASDSAVISFGLVSIPCKIYVACSAEHCQFRLLSPKGNPIKQKNFDSVTEEEVNYQDCNRGFEIEKDKFISFTSDELDEIAGDKVKGIELIETVPCALHPRMIEKSYFLGPDKSERAYRLLYMALKKTNRMVIGRWSRRGKDHLISVIPENDLLMMYQLYYSNEIRHATLEWADTTKPKPEEVKLAIAILDKLSSEEFNLTAYKDHFQERLMRAIEEKRSTNKSSKKLKTKDKNVCDLVAALTQSLDAIPVRGTHKKQ